MVATRCKPALVIGGFIPFQAEYYKREIAKEVRNNFILAFAAKRCAEGWTGYRNIPHLVVFILAKYMQTGIPEWAEAIDWVLSDYRECHALYFDPDTYRIRWNPNFRFNKHNCKYINK